MVAEGWTEEDVFEDQEQDTSPDDEAACVEIADERAQALVKGTLGRQVKQDTGGRKRKCLNSFDDGMDPSALVELVASAYRKILTTAAVAEFRRGSSRISGWI